MIGPRLLTVVALVSVLGDGPAADAADEPPIQPLEVNRTVDLAVTIGAAAVWVTSELLLRTIAPAECRWCDRDAQGNDTLNGLDRSVRDALRWSDPGAANTVSNVTGFALGPIIAFGGLALAANHDGASDGMWDDWLVVAESAALAADLNQLVKVSAGRERPFVHVLTPDQRAHVTFPEDNNVSFYSGHTSLAFSLAVSSGTVATLRGYRLAPVIWAAGLTTAATTGLLRIGADKHYFTDVLTGAVMGSAVGFLVPYVVHRHHAGGPQIAATAGAELTLVRVSWVW